MIYLDDAIEAIEEIAWYHQNRNNEMVSGANDDLHQPWYRSQDIYEALEAVPSAQPELSEKAEAEWIPCSERLPEEDIYVLATTVWGEITMAEKLSDIDWFIYEGNANAKSDDIVAWMPLPEPWKGEER